ncbi:desiccation-associated protein, partial [Genlisea aurea]
EKEMEIGFPTDVRHVAHVGIDGYGSTATFNLTSMWQDLALTGSLSMRQLELAMESR